MAELSSIPKQVSAFRKGDIVLLDNAPCKVVDMSTSKTGKHGGAKVHLTTLNIFTGKKVEQIAGSTATLPSADLNKFEYSVMDIDEQGFTTLIPSEAQGSSEPREDLKLPQGKLGQDIQDAWNDPKENMELVLVVYKVLNMEEIMEFKWVEAKK